MCNCKKNIPTPTVKAKAPVTQNPFTEINSRRSRTDLSSNSDLNRLQNEMEDLSGETMAEKCVAFADLLGLKKAIPEKVLIAALEDPIYAQSLLTSKDNPEILDRLIKNPPETSIPATPEVGNFSNATLISKAGKALFKWGFSGFMTVPIETLARRENACLGCKNLVEPSRIIQRFSASSAITHEVGKRTGNKTCAVCGCVVKNKMRLATDTCPVEDPNLPGTNFWGEAMH